jgi:hypothetical protein
MRRPSQQQSVYAGIGSREPPGQTLAAMKHDLPIRRVRALPPDGGTP